MSWLTGNLSSLANNVSSFTKEVLSEASREDEQALQSDNDTEELNEQFNPALRDELLFLRSEVSNKDEHIRNLQLDYERLKEDAEKHSKNLKQHLLEKEVEIEQFVEKLNQSEAKFEEKIATLSKEKSQLKIELSEKMSNADNDSDWDSDWGGGGSGNNEQEVSILKSENESLCNEISMKEIILNSIESKMQQLSGKNLDVSDFSSWIDDFLGEKLQEKDQAESLTELVLYLKEEMNDDSDEGFDMDVFLEWYTSKKEEKVTLEQKIKKLENTIASVEDSISQYQKGRSQFKIADLDVWLDSLSLEDQSTTSPPAEAVEVEPKPEDNNSKELLLSIQNAIREFDEEDENFEISNFQAWIEKVQNRIDDLEFDLLNEQETKTSDDKQRAEERAKLKEMFDEKEQEIAMLKVELYNASSVTPSTSHLPPDHQQSTPQHTLLQEQLNEAIARSEALQNELQAAKSQETNLIEKHKNEINEVREDTRKIIEKEQNETQALAEQLKKAENSLGEMQNQLVLLQTENVELVRRDQERSLEEDYNASSNVAQLQQARLEIDRLKEELQETLSGKESMVTDNSNICSDIKTMENIVMDVINGEHVVFNESFEASSDKTSSLVKAVQGVVEHSSYLQQENKRISDDLQEVQNQLKEQEEQMIKEQSELSEKQQLLEYMSMMITKMFPNEILPQPFPSPDGFVTMQTQQYETNMIACDAYISQLIQENADLKVETTETTAHTTSNDNSEDGQTVALREEIEELNRKIVLLESKSVDENASNGRINQLQHELLEKNNKIEILSQENTDLKTSILTLENTLQESQQTASRNDQQLTSTPEDVPVNNTQLQATIQTLTQQLTDLQTFNANVQTQNEQLSQQVSQMGSQHATAQKELQGHVTSLNQQLQQYQQFTQNIQAENEHLKRLNAASMTQGPDQEVAMRMELQNQVNILTHENQHYQTEYENLRQGWMKYQQESNTYIESVQGQYQQLQEQYQQLEKIKQQVQATDSIESSSTAADSVGEGGSTAQHQKMHNLSLMLTEKAEECVRYQQENDQLKSKLVEIQNDTSDMELIREECKQLKSMLVSKEHENRIDETISALQGECKQLKNMLAGKETEIEQLHKLSVEKDNDLSDMELLREECKQLKHMLVNKESPAHIQKLIDEKARLENMLESKEEELQRMSASLIDMQNSTSDMDLIREECSQLKQMLMNQKQQESLLSNQSSGFDSQSDDARKQLEMQLYEKDEELRSKNALISELQNTSGDVELLRQQCEQLKVMLSEKDTSSMSLIQNNTGETTTPGMESINVTGMDSSFLLQVQQLEELMKGKDDVIAEKNEELLRKDTIIIELQNNTSDMELLHNECRALKEMISGKEQVFAELQNDLDLANDMIGQRTQELSQKTNEIDELKRQLNELQSLMGEKEKEFETLREEMAEAALQDENIHLLQTEYRNVEEQFTSSQKELHETQQKLFELETHCERLKVYEEQYQDLKNTLKEKEEELGTLRLQSSESSILESETVTLLHQELNQLKSLVYEREEQAKALNDVLEKKNLELQNLSVSFHHTNEMLASEGTQQQNLKQQLEELTNENARLSNQCEQKDRLLEDSNTNLNVEVQRLTQELNSTSQKNYDQAQAHQQTSSQQNLQIKQLQQQIQELRTVQSKLEQEKFEVENTNGQYINTISELQTGIQNLQYHLQQSEQNQQNLLQSISSQEETGESLEALKQQHQVALALVKNLRSLLQLPDHVDREIDISSGLSEAIQSVQWLLTDVQQKETVINRLQSDSQAAIERHQAELTEKLNTTTELETKLVTLRAEHAQNSSEKDFKITDLQSQLQEFNELESMYQQKCKECEILQATALVTTDTLQRSPDPTEYEKLREELTRNSHSLLEKNKECDSLKLDILQLEEKLFSQQQALSQMPNTEAQLAQMNELKNLCQAKDAELQNLQSQLEDSYAMLEGGKKEKEFLDQLVKEKNAIAAEKEELIFQNGQMSSRLKELEVEVKQKDINSKEIEVKTKRELERLRNHLMMIEENHTKDIIECQDREEKLKEELDAVKDTLGKKSVILQDSNKQFQDHVGTLEEQLHVLAAQRDTSALDLEKCREKIENDSMAMFNLQNALEQLQKEKDEQYEYLMAVSHRQKEEYEVRIEELVAEQEKAQSAMSEASLAVQGITKLQLEMEQKDRELVVNKERITELTSALQQREMQCKEMLKASDTKMEKSLIKNLLMKYFQSPEDKRADIVKVVGGLLGMTFEEINEIGSGAAPSKVGGWISNVWGYTTPKKQTQPSSPGLMKHIDINQSFSELFVKFLENESTNKKPVDSSASLTNAEVPLSSANVPMLSLTTPDILSFHNKPENTPPSPNATIPAPGQEIPRVHTHHAQSTLKNLLS